MTNVVIIGGGISGLSTAFALQKEAARRESDISVTILEKEGRPGGKIWSCREQGYLCEWGPNGFLDSKPWTLELCRDAGLASRLLRSSDKARKRFVFSQGQLHQLPDNAREFFRSRLVSWPGKLRLCCELLIPAKLNDFDETLADFARRRLGHEALEKLIGPMVSGVFAGDPETMSLKSCFPRIHELETEYGGLVKALFKLQKKRRRERKSGKQLGGPSGPGGVLTSFYDGTDELISGLVEVLKGDIRTQARVGGIRKEVEGFEITLENGGLVQAAAVISACPAYELGGIVADMDQEMAEILRRIPYAPLAVVCCGYEREKIAHDVNGFGFLAARGEKRTVLGTLWDSSIFPNRAPAGRVLLRSMVGGATCPEVLGWSDEELKRKVLDDLHLTMGIDKNPEFIRIFVHEKAIPQYLCGHGKLIEGMADRLRFYPGFFLTGNAFFGVGINDCVKAATETAVKVLDFMEQRG